MSTPRDRDLAFAPVVAPGPAVVPAVPAERERPKVRLLALLALGHLVIDVNQGALPAILPYLRTALELSYTATGTIVLMATITSSLIQPLFGYLADQTARRWLLPLSVVLASLGIALTGLAPSYAAVLGLVVISGLGVAAYHPEGFRAASQVAGDRKATGLSIFSTGGNIGIAAGPPLITALVTGVGLRGSLGLLVPGVLVAGLLMTVLPRLSVSTASRAHETATARGRTMVGGILLLIGVVTVRSWTQLGFTTFIPFYYLDVLRGDPRLVGTLLAVFLGAGAVGTLVAGPIADRIGARKYIVIIFLLAAPLAASVLLTRGLLSLILLGALGFVLISTFTVSVVLAQAYLPRNIGMASGLIVGLAIGTGGLGVAVLGWVADHWGVVTALWAAALMPLLGFLVALRLPDPPS
jgi:FSR family fosmidomycin resistance protein-like MFS transporter